MVEAAKVTLAGVVEALLRTDKEGLVSVMKIRARPGNLDNGSM